MGTLVFQANLGGAVNLIGPNTASTVNFTLPSADGTSGQALVTNGSGTLSFSTFTTGAAGSNTQVQFNSSGAFAGSANLTFDGTTLTAAGLSGPLNGTVGATTPNTGAFTTLSASSTVTLSGGTANGVGYLNGSKQFTTGSALTFDGNNLTQSGPNAAVALQVNTANVGVSSSNYSEIQLADLGVIRSYWRSVRDGSGATIFSGNDHIRYALMGTEYMRLTSTGLGIGTSSPASKLEVYNSAVNAAFVPSTASTWRVAQLRNDQTGTSNTAAGIAFVGKSDTSPAGIVAVNKNTTGGVLDLAFLPVSGNTTFEAMRLDSSGNLGLGVTPGSGLTVGGGSLSTKGVITAAGALSAHQTSMGVLEFNGNKTSIRSYGATAGTGYIAFNIGGGGGSADTQAMTLDASGNLLIGQTSVAAGWGGSNRLAIKQSAAGAYQGVLVTSSSNDYGIFMGHTGSVGTIGVSYAGSGAFTPLTFETGGSERARIDSSGNLLVGTTGSNGKVTSWNPGGNAFHATINATNSGLYVSSNGQSNTMTAATFDTNYGVVGSITCGSSTAYNTSSDYRLKDNQQPLTGSGAFIDALQPKTWEWKADGSKGVGFIAHEVQAVSPGSVVGEKDAVDEDGKPKYQAMEYGSAEFIANIVAELQSLRKRVAQLEGK